ncbi:MAG: acylphosphatase [Chloroflexi bacterium]|nr:acylphosphatase [Chloroflexota bacterium]
MLNTPVRIHIWVKGRVQGVGFRAFVADCAAQIGLNGWVRNVNWDTVETIAEGSRKQIDQFLQAVKTGPTSSRVDDCRAEEETFKNEFVDFEIRSSR